MYMLRSADAACFWTIGKYTDGNLRPEGDERAECRDEVVTRSVQRFPLVFDTCTSENLSLFGINKILN